ncbi:hypothetical protein D9758_009739 [Tetrapyrgos nigripes]|uniref:Uncharacterized protein n=1 Tax=Tetrapyrgos nigripes TaxID=182062 RepID=A0A8H5GKG1_9AGAR|nr:hypothetical protein D9758_009739 [Tetrapyrgos nigripes]
MSLPSFREEGVFRGLYIGTWLSMGLYGANAVQCWTYYNNNNDRWTLRSVISLLFALDTAVTCIESGALYRSLLSIQKEPSTRAPVTDIVIIFLAATVVFIVDLFFAAKVHYLGRCHWTVVAFIVTMALIAAGTGLAGIVNLSTAEDNRDILTSKETIPDRAEPS